jgi:hypothetical protein
MAIVGSILDMVDVSCDVAGASYEELGWCANMYLLCSFTTPVRAHHFASSIVTPWGYKASGHPCGNLRLLAQSPIASSPPFLWLKRKREIER